MFRILIGIIFSSCCAAAFAEAEKPPAPPPGWGDEPKPAPVAPKPPAIHRAPTVKAEKADASADDGPSIHHVGDSITVGDMVVTLALVTNDKMVMETISHKEDMSDEKFLWLVVSIKNTSDTKKREYVSWCASFPSRTKGFASVVDNFGNGYKRIRFNIGATPKGHTEGDSIYPNAALMDVLAFEPLTDNATFVDIKLPLRNISDSDEELSFRVRRADLHNFNKK